MKTHSSLLLSVAAVSIALSSTGCSAIGSVANAAPVYNIQMVPDNTMVTDRGCSDKPPITDFYHINATSAGITNTYPYAWTPTQHIGFLLNVDASRVKYYGAAVNSAITRWNTQLSAQKQGNVTIQFNEVSLPAASTAALPNNVNNPVIVSDVKGEDPNSPDAAGETAIEFIRAQTSMYQAFITLYTDGVTQVNDQRGDPSYPVAIHEFGHALGLGHNDHSSSVMAADIGMADGDSPFSFCFGDYDPIPVTDVSSLEGYYDSSGFTKPPVACPTDPHGTSIARSSNRFISRPNPPTCPQMTMAPANRIEPRRGLKYWLNAEDIDGSVYASSESLLLSSSLVAQGTPGAVLSTIPYGGRSLQIRQVTLNAIYRHALGPDAGVHAGDSILVLDQVGADGAEFADDAALVSGQDSVLFLSRSPYWTQHLNLGRPIYLPAIPMISKFGVNSRQQLVIKSIRSSRASRELNLTTAQALYNRASSQYGSQALLSEESLLLALLAKRGIVTSKQISDYVSTLTSNPTAVRSSLIAYDILHP